MARPALELPCCCCFKDGPLWREVLLLAELRPGCWLELDEDWAFAETSGLFLQAWRRGQCHFAGPTTPGRFAELEEELREGCRWLRTSSEGWPQPGPAGEGLTWPRRSSMGQVQIEQAEEGLRRGGGRGVLRREVLERVMEEVRKMQQAMLGPAEFLREALELWGRLVHAFQAPMPVAREEEASSQSSQEAAGKRRSALRRRGQQEKAEKLLRCCWHLLPRHDRAETLSEAAEEIGKGLRGILMESLQAGEDLEGIRGSVHGFLSRQVAEMSVAMAERSKTVTWGIEQLANRVLAAFETQLGLTFEKHRGYFSRQSGHFSMLSLEPEWRAAALCRPSAGQCSQLQQWRRALAKMQLLPQRPPGPASPSSSLFLRQPPASQRCVASFLLGHWPDFSRLARVSRRCQALCFEPGSWIGSAVRVASWPQAPIFFKEERAESARQVRTNIRWNRAMFPAAEVSRGSHLSHMMVTLLRLGLSATSESTPIVLFNCPAQLQRLIKDFQVPGLALAYSFNAKVLYSSLLDAVLPGSACSVATRQLLQAHTDQESRCGVRLALQLPPAPSREEVKANCEVRMAVSSGNGLPAVLPRHLGLGGIVYEATFAEVAFGFQESLVSEVGLVLALKFLFLASSVFGMMRSQRTEAQPGSPQLQLMILGSGQAQRTWGKGLAPGAYLVRLPNGEEPRQEEEEEDLPQPVLLPQWNLSRLKRNDRLGLALLSVKNRRTGQEEAVHGLVFVHNGQAVGGRWFQAFHSSLDMERHVRLQLEGPLSKSGGTLTCLGVTSRSCPAMQDLLSVLGDCPVEES